MQSSETMSSAMATAHRYHEWVFGTFAGDLRPGVALEIGTGHGMYSRRIAPRVDELIVSDIDPAAVERARAALSDHVNVRYVVMDGIDAQTLGRPVDNIVLVNVLEHIEDDAGFLRRCHDCLAPGGALVLFVPAFPLLYSRMDRQAGHFRRYRRDGLRQLVTDCGFQLSQLRYVNAVGFFGWLVNKWLGSGVDSTTTNVQVTLYDRLIPLLRRVDPLMPFLGQSLVAVGTRR